MRGAEVAALVTIVVLLAVQAFLAVAETSLTRIGFGSKAVVTGDTTQVDVPGGRSGLGGLEQVLAGIEGLAFVRLTSKDVVRHRIVQEIVDAYERAAAPAPAPPQPPAAER